MRLYFLYCPFCNGNGWNLMNTPSSPQGRYIVHHRCERCRKFTFCNSAIKSKIILPVSFSAEEAHSIEAEIGDFTIEVNYVENKTHFRKKLPLTLDFMAPMPPAFKMTLDRAVEFDWHNQDKILLKIKTFIMLT